VISTSASKGKERGVALVTSLLLLVIITILALSMFRSFNTQERIAGNLREKERALHAAASAQQYAEWWLLQANNTAGGPVPCTSVVAAGFTAGQICDQTPQQQLGVAALTQVLPWPIRVTYAPDGMLFGTQPPVAGNPNPPYFDQPAYWITKIGRAADNAGDAYQIDAYGYGSSASTVAIVESVYEVAAGLNCLGCNQ
jgi:type IV pilus assembly protein PilX